MAMLENPGSVPVLIIWKQGRGTGSTILEGEKCREFPLLGMTATQLPSEKVQRLAASRAVRSVLLDSGEGSSDASQAAPEPPSPVALEERGKGVTWGLAAIEAERTWKELGVTGQGVRVGIVDSGIDASNPMFSSRVVGWKDFISGASAPGDVHGHGTHIAGTIAGTATPDGVKIGVAPGASLVIARASHDNGFTTSSAIAAMEFVADPDGDPSTDDGARVVNCSFSNFPKEDDPIFTECIERLSARNVFVVFSAGNNGQTGADSVGSPGVLSCSFTIGAVGSDSRRWLASSYGAAHLGNRPRGYLKPDVVGPGNDILSVLPGPATGRWNGTSMATPHIAGVAALMFQAHPKLTVKEAREIIEDTCTPLGDRLKSSEYGAGLVNAYGAVKRAAELAKSAPPAVSVPRLLAEGDEALASNNLPRAVDRFIAVIGLSSADLAGETAQRAMYSLGLAYAQQWNFRGAVGCFRKMLQIAPSGSYGARAQFQVGLAYRRTPPREPKEIVTLMEKAIREFDALIKRHAGSDLVPAALLEKAGCLVTLQKRAQARTLVDQVLGRWADRPEYAGPARELLEELAEAPADPLGQ
ncbi:MAG: S8 family serine peptidase [Candidatus Riflebacteria bacterium]|nr:S8 family serine peptidase [Candidatus Riflebacteria bacterium]